LKDRQNPRAHAGPIVLAAMLFASALLGGCNEQKDLWTWDPFAVARKPSVPAGKISVYDLASRLDLVIQSSSAAGAALARLGNQVMIYADPGGQVYVNGELVLQGGIVPVRGVLHVPAETVARVQEALHRYRRPRPLRRSRPVRRGSRRIDGRIVIDPGHGGRDPGAIAATGLREKTVVLDVAQQVAYRLRQAGATVKMTRTGDVFVELNERAAIANRFSADLFVSIHADAAARSSAEGYGTYVARAASSGSVRLAEAVGRSLSAAGVPRHGTFRRDFRVVVLTRCPAVLIELGFLSNAAEAARLGGAAYRRKLAEAIAEGVCDFMRGS